MRTLSPLTRTRKQCRLLLASCASAFLLAWAPGAEARPINVTPPVISGDAEVGQVLTTSTGTWRDSSSPIVSYQYEWLLCPYPGECVFHTSATSSYWTLPWEADDEEAEVAVYAIDEEGEIEVAMAAPTPKIGYGGPYYSVSESVSGSGTIQGHSAGEPDSTLLCPGQCGYARFIPGEDIELVAEPALGATFLGWGGACSGTSPTCSLTMGGDESVTARFSTVLAPTPLPESKEADAPGESGEAAAGGSDGALGSGEVPSSSVAHLPARLLGLHAQRGHGHRLQATVACEQTRACRLVLAASSNASGSRLIASRTLTLAAGRSESIDLTLNDEGARLLARRRRLPVTAHLMLREGERWVGVGGAHLTLVA